MNFEIKPIGTTEEFRSVFKKIQATTTKKRKSETKEISNKKKVSKSVDSRSVDLTKIAHRLSKRHELDDKKESEVFPNIISYESHSDVPSYWALGSEELPVLSEHKVVFVTGPFEVKKRIIFFLSVEPLLLKDENSVTACLLSNIFKKRLSSEYVSSVEMAIFTMIPDRSGKKKTKPQSFIVCKDIMGIPVEWFENKKSITIKDINEDDNIYGIPLSGSHLKQLDSDEESADDDDKPWYRRVQMSLICSVLYRYAFRIEKTSLQDLILDRDSGLVYSMNETSLFSSKMKGWLFNETLKLEYANILKKWMRRYERDIMFELRNWVKLIQQKKNMIAALSVINYDMSQLINSINTLTSIDLAQTLL